MNNIEEFQIRLKDLLEEFNVYQTEPISLELLGGYVESRSTSHPFKKDVEWQRSVTEGEMTLKLKVRSVSDWQIKNKF